MYFSYRTRQRLKWVVLLTVCGVVLFGTLAYFWPFSGQTSFHSAVVWVLGAISILVIWVVLEALGAAFLSLPLWEKLPSVVRVGLLVVVGACLMAALFALGGK